MSKVYGPYNATSNPVLTVGGITHLQVDQTAGAVTISNQSITYDVLVTFGGTKPPNVVAQSGGDWPIVVHAGHVETVTLTNDSGTPTPLGTYWTGDVWLLVIDTSPMLAQNGTGPTLGSVWVKTYAPGEPVSDTSASSFVTAAGSQQRVIALAPDPWLNAEVGSWSLGGGDYKLGSVNCTPNQQVQWRIYGIRLGTWQAASAYLEFGIVAKWETGAGVLVAQWGSRLYHSIFTIPGTLVDTPAVPISARGAAPATTAKCSIYLQQISNSGNITSTFAGMVSADVVVGGPVNIPTPQGGQGGTAVLQTATVF